MFAFNRVICPHHSTSVLQEPVWKPDAYEPPKEVDPQSAERIDEKKTAEELEELEDEFGDDRVLEKYR